MPATWRSVTNGRKRWMPYDNEEKIKQNHDLAERDEPNGTMNLTHGPDSRIQKAHFEISHTLTQSGIERCVK